MKDKHKLCKDCVYRVGLEGGGYSTGPQVVVRNLACGYSLFTRETALKSDEHGNITDSRGTDPNRCKLRTTAARKRKMNCAAKFEWIIEDEEEQNEPNGDNDL